MASTNFFHARLRVPREDEAVLEWLHNQQNVSTSLRLLIRADISAHGTSDILTRPPVGWHNEDNNTSVVDTTPHVEVTSTPPQHEKMSVSQVSAPQQDEPDRDDDDMDIDDESTINTEQYDVNELMSALNNG